MLDAPTLEHGSIHKLRDKNWRDYVKTFLKGLMLLTLLPAIILGGNFVSSDSIFTRAVEFFGLSGLSNFTAINFGAGFIATSVLGSVLVGLKWRKTADTSPKPTMGFGICVCLLSLGAICLSPFLFNSLIPKSVALAQGGLCFFNSLISIRESYIAGVQTAWCGKEESESDLGSEVPTRTGQEEFAGLRHIWDGPVDPAPHTPSSSIVGTPRFPSTPQPPPGVPPPSPPR